VDIYSDTENHQESHRLHAPSPSFVGAAVAAVCVGELTAKALNRFLGEDLVPIPSRAISRLSWVRVASGSGRFAARAAMWTTLAAGAVAIQAKASAKRAKSTGTTSSGSSRHGRV
jgi:hypothetical protein